MIITQVAFSFEIRCPKCMAVNLRGNINTFQRPKRTPANKAPLPKPLGVEEYDPYEQYTREYEQWEKQAITHWLTDFGEPVEVEAEFPSDGSRSWQCGYHRLACPHREVRVI